MGLRKTRTIGERTLDVLQGGMSRGREAMNQAVDRGTRAIDEWLPPRRNPMEGWLWFAGGAAAALALLMGRRAAPSLWNGRRVAGVMVHDVQTIESTVTVAQAAQRMRDANVGVLPVMENGRLRGVITDRDIVVRAVARGADPSSMRVSDVMTNDLITARTDWTVDQAMQTMADHQIGRLPVVDEMDRVVGIVTLSSLALRAARGDAALETAKEVSRRSARAV